jgi:hypothetical protein
MKAALKMILAARQPVSAQTRLHLQKQEACRLFRVCSYHFAGNLANPRVPARPKYGSDYSESQHRIGDFLKAGDVSALNIIDIAAALIAISDAPAMDAMHDVEEHLLQFFLFP